VGEKKRRAYIAKSKKTGPGSERAEIRDVILMLGATMTRVEKRVGEGTETARRKKKGERRRGKCHNGPTFGGS